ncbi:MAG: hypothetical protein PVI00_08605 [Desulfobacterales bacterium]
MNKLHSIIFIVNAHGQIRSFIDTQYKNIRSAVMPHHVNVKAAAGECAQIQFGLQDAVTVVQRAR